MKIPENFSNLSSPIMISSMRSQVPSFTFSGQSKVETISPPVNIANEKIFQIIKGKLHNSQIKGL